MITDVAAASWPEMPDAINATNKKAIDTSKKYAHIGF